MLLHREKVNIAVIAGICLRRRGYEKLQGMGKFVGMRDVGQLKAVLEGRFGREMGDGIYGYTLFDLSVLMLGYSVTLMEREMMEQNPSLNLCRLRDWVVLRVSGYIYREMFDHEGQCTCLLWEYRNISSKHRVDTHLNGLDKNSRVYPIPPDAVER
jgi:hypothetical protein